MAARGKPITAVFVGALGALISLVVIALRVQDAAFFPQRVSPAPTLPTQESHYYSVQDARQRGAFDRGWIPEILPDDATDIWELHTLDTGVSYGCFSSPQGSGPVRALLDKQGARRETGPVSDWWPQSMTQPQIEAYEFKGGPGFTVRVKVDTASGKVCFHRTTASMPRNPSG